MNPMTYLDAILSEYASAKTRRLIHTLILLVGAVVTIILAVDGDWKAAIAAVAAALYAGANRANTTPEEPEEPLYGTQEPLYRPGSDEEGFGGDAPAPDPYYPPGA